MFCEIFLRWLRLPKATCLTSGVRNLTYSQATTELAVPHLLHVAAAAAATDGDDDGGCIQMAVEAHNQCHDAVRKKVL